MRAAGAAGWVETGAADGVCDVLAGVETDGTAEAAEPAEAALLVTAGVARTASDTGAVVVTALWAQADNARRPATTRARSLLNNQRGVTGVRAVT
jgi:hypothetical protein